MEHVQKESTKLAGHVTGGGSAVRLMRQQVAQKCYRPSVMKSKVAVITKADNFQLSSFQQQAQADRHKSMRIGV